MTDEEYVNMPVQPPQYIQPEEVMEEVTRKPIKINGGDDMSDMFRTPQPEDEDMDTDDLTKVTDNDVYGDGGADMSDITSVSKEDIMRGPRTTRKRKMVRTAKYYPENNPTSMGRY